MNSDVLEPTLLLLTVMVMPTITLTLSFDSELGRILVVELCVADCAVHLTVLLGRVLDQGRVLKPRQQRVPAPRKSPMLFGMNELAAVAAEYLLRLPLLLIGWGP